MEDDLAKDFVALWQSELAAMAADREVRESLVGMLALWASTASLSLDAMRGLAREPAGGAHAAQPARATPAAAASEPGLAAVEQLNRRIAELEQRVAGLIGSRAEPGAEPRDIAQGTGGRDRV